MMMGDFFTDLNLKISYFLWAILAGATLGMYKVINWVLKYRNLVDANTIEITDLKASLEKANVQRVELMEELTSIKTDVAVIKTNDDHTIQSLKDIKETLKIIVKHEMDGK